MDELSQRQQALLKKIEQARTFDWPTISNFLCEYFKVPDVQFIKPFGEKRPAFSLMRKVELGVEFGSVQKEEGVPPATVTFKTAKGIDPEEQKAACLLDPTSRVCKFLNSPIPSGEPICRPDNGQPLPYDFNNVACYSVSVKHAWSNFHIYVAGRLNFRHKGMEELYEMEQRDAIYRASGGIAGQIMTIKNTPGQGVEIRDCFPIAKQEYGYLNEHFVATMGLVNERNLLHGIIHIPREVCKQARLIVYEGVPEPPADYLEKTVEAMGLKPDDPKGLELARERSQQAWREAQVERQGVDTFEECKFNDHYVAIPVNHVLAWPLVSERFVEEHEFQVQQFRVLYPKAVSSEILYFLVGSANFDILLDFFRSTWLQKVDRRPLSQIGFEFLPMIGHDDYPDPVRAAQAHQGMVAVRSYFTYFVHPVLPPRTIDNLAPMLHPNMPPPHIWCDNLLAAQLLQDQQLGRH